MPDLKEQLEHSEHLLTEMKIAIDRCSPDMNGILEIDCHDEMYQMQEAVVTTLRDMHHRRLIYELQQGDLNADRPQPPRHSHHSAHQEASRVPPGQLRYEHRNGPQHHHEHEGREEGDLGEDRSDE
jgi:hypothetical protein